LPRERDAIDEIDRVSNEKAGLMVTVPLKYRFINPVLLPLNFVHDKKIGHLRRYDVDTILRKFNKWQEVDTYYTGHFGKVLKTLINKIINVFDENTIEINDNSLEKVKYGASNIIIFLKKKIR